MTKISGALLLAIAAQAASAGVLSFSGVFTQDDQIVSEDFTLAQGALVSAFTTSFGLGGFAPVLSLFSTDTTPDLLQVAMGTSNTCATPGAGAMSDGLCWDASFSTTLTAGSYELVLSQDGNLPNGTTVADGFSQTGNPTYTGSDNLGDASLSFINLDGTQRSGAYAATLDITPIPEPRTITLLLIGLFGIACVSRRKATSSFIFTQ